MWKKRLIRLVKVAIYVVAVYASFKIQPLLGVAFTVLTLGWIMYRSRARYYGIRANAQFYKGDVEAAVQWMEKATNVSPCPLDFHISYSFLLLKTGDPVKAEQASKRILEITDEREARMQAMMNWSLAAWMQGRQEEGYERMLEVFDKYKNTIAYGNLGYMMILRGELEEALTFNLEAYEYNDSNNTIVDNLAQTYYLLGQYEKANEKYEELFKKKQTYAESSYYYALTLEQMGEIEEALERIEQASEMELSFMSPLKKEEILQEQERLTKKAETYRMIEERKGGS